MQSLFFVSITLFALSSAYQITRPSLKWKLSFLEAAPKVPTVNVEFLPSNVIANAQVGQPLSVVAEESNVEIKYKCRKVRPPHILCNNFSHRMVQGECGTCQVNIGGKWVKACQTVIPSMPLGENFQVTVKPAAAKEKAAFFSPKSLYDGFVNNALGVAGFVGAVTSADEEFQARMAKEAALKAKVEAKKQQSRS